MAGDVLRPGAGTRPASASLARRARPSGRPVDECGLHQLTPGMRMTIREVSGVRHLRDLAVRLPIFTAADWLERLDG